MKSDILKQLALKAKNRLINKTNEDKKEQKENDFRIKIIKSGDDSFYAKVKDLLERDEDVLNPIKELMDEAKLSRMSSGEKEKYLLETVDKYTKFRNLIEYEKQVNYGY